MSTTAAHQVKQAEFVGISRETGVASGAIYMGDFVSLNASSGAFRKAVSTDRFMGIAENDAADGEPIQVVFNHLFEANVTSADGTKRGLLVAATADDTLVLRNAEVCCVGPIVKYISGTKCQIWATRPDVVNSD